MSYGTPGGWFRLLPERRRVPRGVVANIKGPPMLSRTSISALAFVLASAGSAAAFPATATTDLNVRAGPGTGYSVIDTLQAGDTVEVTGTRGSWYQLASGGWASGSYLDSQGSAAADPYEPGYTVVETYGPPAFYVGVDPYYWDDAGFYWYWRDGRRHRVSHDDWRGRDYRDFRFTDARHRSDFERRIGGFEGRASSVEPPRRWEGGSGERRIVPRILD